MSESKVVSMPRPGSLEAIKLTFQRVEELVREAKLAAHKATDRALECGRLLTELKGALCHEGPGNPGNCARDTISFDALLQDLVPSISIRTAYRWMQAAEAWGLSRQIAEAPEGELIVVEDGEFEVTDELRGKADAVSRSIMEGDTPLTRAMPAVRGILVNKGAGTGGREATNHPRNALAGVKKLETSLRPELWENSAEWAAVEEAFQSLLGRRLPDAFEQILANRRDRRRE